jgi:hypothetical protein
MDIHEMVLHRLRSQRLWPADLQFPGEVVSWMLAVQGQDFVGAKWSLGLRLPKSTDAGVERAIAHKIILRSWLLRGTLHLVSGTDILWLLALLGPGTIAGNKRRYRELELDEATLLRSNDLLAHALQGNDQLGRKELFALLRQNGISTEGQRGVYMLQRASLEGLICQGVMHANNPTFMKLDGFPSKVMNRQEALAELARRYFLSRGPATLQDFTWWSGLPAAEARAGLDSIQSLFIHESIDEQIYWWSPSLPITRGKTQTVFLLPGFDEFLLAYKDRRASLGLPNYGRLAPANGMLPGTIVINGRVVGTWKRTFKKGSVIISTNPFNPLSSAEAKGTLAAANRLGKFLGMPVILS